MPSTNMILTPRTGGREQRAQEKLALVIPTLCEAENIGGLLQNVQSVLNPLRIRYEILVVDDDSNDGTGDVVAAIANHDPRVRLLVRKGQRGLSGAILHGWQNTDATIVGVMDADLQHLRNCWRSSSPPSNAAMIWSSAAATRRRRPGQLEPGQKAAF